MKIDRDDFLNMLYEKQGKDITEKILGAKVCICGLGGLGSNIAVLLARAGVGNLHIIDFDKVELSNLNRQQYNINHIGLYKTDALEKIIADIAPYCKIKKDTVRIDRENIPSLLKNETIICEAFDKAEEKAMIAEEILSVYPEKYLISGSGMGGIKSSDMIKTRKVMKNFYLCGDEVSDETEGILSARVMICAAHQANMALRLICGETQI